MYNLRDQMLSQMLTDQSAGNFGIPQMPSLPAYNAPKQGMGVSGEGSGGMDMGGLLQAIMAMFGSGGGM